LNTRKIQKKINKMVYQSIREEGIKRISRGSFHVDEKLFLDTVEKISDVLSEQQFVPEFGIDGMFLQYLNEKDAEDAKQRIVERGIKADTMQERTAWKVKVEF
jgi:hypothetical protein